MSAASPAFVASPIDEGKRNAIFFASFLTLIAAGMGFGVRGGILDAWSQQFGFTKFELGATTGAGLAGFGMVILAASMITDRIGYKTIMLLAFVCHLISAGIIVAATPVYNSYLADAGDAASAATLEAAKNAVFNCLYAGMFVFSIGNGLAEAAINPLVATLYPRRKTHYLNILHAGWPAGLVIGALVAKFLGGVRWEVPMLSFLVPAFIYGGISILNRFPISEARAAGVSFGRQLAEFASPLLLFLLLLHACVGYVELGTDSWISNITNLILEGQGLYLFIWASSIMFVLRFFAGPIVERINPLGLLFCSACLGAIGLYLIGSTAGVMVWVAVTIYGLGKTFLWPTMLGVVGERFPRGGAVTMGAMGGIGMLSAGLLGGPAIGYQQDHYASENLRESSPQTYQRYQADKPNNFLAFETQGLDGQKVAVIKGETAPGKALAPWWQQAETHVATDKPAVVAAVLYGGRMALKWTALVPALLAVGYLLLVLYFRTRGGYKAEHLTALDATAPGEEFTGGVPAPVR